MRIAHVLTYVSTDGAFGGPVAVLAEQTAELARRGHDVEIFAGWDGEVELDVPGARAHLFRTRSVLPIGFSGMIAPGLRRAILRRRDLDVVHVHLARDLITAPVAHALRRSADVRLFLQPHGMVKPDRRPRGRLSDLLIRPTLAGATATFALTAVDRERLLAVEPRTRLVDLPNGVTLPPLAERPARERPEVLFLARLQPRKRVLLFAEAARRLLERGVEADFRVVGPDEGDLSELTDRIHGWGLAGRIRYEGSVPPGAGRDRIARADVYVLPSLNEPFPMSVLEAMSTGTPTVISSSCHIADRLGDAVAAFPEDASDRADALAAVIGGLLEDDTSRLDLGRRGRDRVASAFSVEHVADLLEGYYSGRATGGGTEGGHRGTTA